MMTYNAILEKTRYPVSGAVTVVLWGLLSCTTAPAQTTVVTPVLSPATIEAVNDYAVKQYLRGHFVEASTEFQRVLQLDPANATAKDYLKRIANLNQPGNQPRPAAAEGISAEIARIKAEIARSERNNAVLEKMISDLSRENTILLLTVAKRNRDIMELRQQLFGISDTQRYLTELPDEPLPPGYSSERELEKIRKALKPGPVAVREVSTGQGRDVTAMRQVSIGDALQAQESALRDQRDLLADKASVEKTKTRQLEKVRDHLARSRDLMKDADERAASQTASIDSGISDEKVLKEQLRQRTEEMIRLQQSLEVQAPELKQAQQDLQEEDYKLIDLDQKLYEKTQQVEHYQNMVSKLQRQIDDQKIQAAQQTQTIDAVGTGLDDLKARAAAINESLQQGGATTGQLREHITRLKVRWDEQQKLIAAQNETIQDLKKQLSALHQNLSQAPKPPSEKAAAPAVGVQSGDVQDRILKEQKAQISDLQEQLKKAQDDLKNRQIESQSVAQQAGVVQTEERAAETTPPEVGAATPPPTEPDIASLNEINFLRKTLAQKENALEELKEKMVAQQEQVGRLNRKVEEYETSQGPKQIAQLQKQVDQLNAKIAAAETSQEASVANMAMLQSMAKVNDEKKHELALLFDNKLQLLTKDLEDMRKQLNEKDQYLSGLERELSGKGRQIAEKTRDVKLFETQLAQVQDKVVKLEKNQSEYEAVKLRLAAMRQELSESRSRLADKESASRRMESDLKKARAQLKDYETRMIQRQKDVSNLEFRVKELTETVQFKDEAIKHETSRADFIKKELSESQANDTKIQRTLSEKDEQISGLVEKLELAKNRQQDLEQHVKSAQEKIDQVYVMVRDGDKTIRTLREELLTKDQKLEALQRMLKEKE